MVVISKNIDFFFIKFPIIFPIIYFVLLLYFPSYENVIILSTIFFLAEPHFGATWPFFFHPNNKNYIYDEKIKLIYFPVAIVFFCLIGYFYFKPTFLLIFFAANVFHVTRQSFGISKLYLQNKNSATVIELLMYTFNSLFFLVGFFRFYIPVISSVHTFTLSILMIFFIFLSIVYIYFKCRSFNDTIIFFTGSIIFFPICFVENPVHAIIMGVTMHYSQYIALTFKVTKQREVINNLGKNNFLQKTNLKFLLILFVYSIFLTLISLSGKSDNELYKNIIIIGITLQMLHFYIDSQLWKFSIKHNRDNVLKLLFK